MTDYNEIFKMMATKLKNLNDQRILALKALNYVRRVAYDKGDNDLFEKMCQSIKELE